MRLHSRLALLVIGTALPIVVLAALAAAVLITQEQAKFVDALKQRNRAFLTAVDSELRGHISTLEALTALPNLTQGDLQALHRDLIAVQRSQPDWIRVVLTLPDGTPVVNTLTAWGDALPAPLDPASVRTVARTGRPLVGNVSTEAAADQPGIPVRVPVLREGRVVYVLTAVVKPAAFARIIQGQRIPSDWVNGLVDREFRFVARTPELPVGSLASASFRAETAKSDEGWYRGATVEGFDTYTVFTRSGWTGWASGLAVPAAVVLAPVQRTAMTIATIAVLCIGVALLTALWLGRRIAWPISALAAQVASLGRPGATFDVASDVPEVRELSKAMRMASAAIADREQIAGLERKVLEESDRAKDEFIAMLSHEMRNPLAAITAAASLLKVAAPGTEAQSSARAVIERQTRQLSRLVEDLLEASRVAMGKVSLERGPVDFADLVCGVIDGLRQSGRLREQEVITRIAPAWVDGDRERLVQVVTNLIDNAAKFTATRGRITISVSRIEQTVALIVADTGIGIPEQDLTRVFDLFVQGGQDLSRNRGGMGVGLALVKRLVEMHGGRVSVESRGPDEGSTFSVTLPAIDPPQSAQPVTPQKWKACLSILLVEDNDDARHMLRALLVVRGHAVTDVADARQAMDAAQRTSFDVAFVDIGLPDTNGYDLARMLRSASHTRAMRLVALTGYAQPDDQSRAYDAGFDLHVTKPLDPDALDRLLADIAEAQHGEASDAKATRT